MHQAAARVRALAWVGAHRRAVWADLRAIFHELDPLGLPAPTFVALAELAPYYAGATAAALEQPDLERIAREERDLKALLAQMRARTSPTAALAGRVGGDTGQTATGHTAGGPELGPDGTPVRRLPLTPGTSRAWGGEHEQVHDDSDEGGRWAALAAANGLDPSVVIRGR